VYVAEATALLASPEATAIASSVSVESITMGPPNLAEDVFGMVPSVV
jgi:hypothetical protein